MNQKRIIELARQAGFEWYGKHIDQSGDYDVWKGDIERFSTLVAAEEREQCANVVETFPHWLGENGRREIADAIRARKP